VAYGTNGLDWLLWSALKYHQLWCICIWAIWVNCSAIVHSTGISTFVPSHFLEKCSKARSRFRNIGVSWELPWLIVIITKTRGKGTRMDKKWNPLKIFYRSPRMSVSSVHAPYSPAYSHDNRRNTRLWGIPAQSLQAVHSILPSLKYGITASDGYINPNAFPALLSNNYNQSSRAASDNFRCRFIEAVGSTEMGIIDGASSELASVIGGCLGGEGKLPYVLYCIIYCQFEKVSKRYELLVPKRSAGSAKMGKEILWSGAT